MLNDDGASRFVPEGDKVKLDLIEIYCHASLNAVWLECKNAYLVMHIEILRGPMSQSKSY